jgi:hypothetical protein
MRWKAILHDYMKGQKALFVLLFILLASCIRIPSYRIFKHEKKEVRDVGSTIQLFVDDWLIEKVQNVHFKLHSPKNREVVFTFDKPWEGRQSGYITLLQDGEIFRMYYRGGGDLSREYLCLAEGKDGIHWERPNLGLCEFDGSKENNIVLTGKDKAYCEAHNFAPFIDRNPAAAPEERYKAVALGRHRDEAGETRLALSIFSSPDGLHWKKMRDNAVITEGAFDSLNTVFWDVVRKRYVCYFRVTQRGKRGIARCTSDDFINWSKPEQLDYGQTPPEHLYTNNIIQYFCEPHIYLGFPVRFIPERTKIGFEEKAIDGVSDGVFMSSRDGLHWSRLFMEAFIRPGLNPNNWGEAHGNNAPAWGILQTSENELSLYWVENCLDIPRLRRGVVRPDGFASLNASYSGGEFITHPFRFEGMNLKINYSTSAVGGIRVEIQDIKGHPIRGFELDSCQEMYGDEVSRIVAWKGRTDVRALSAQPIRLRFVLRDADLFSLRFQ